MRRNALGKQPARRSSSSTDNAHAGERKMPALRQTSLIPGAWISSDSEESDKSGVDYEDPNEGAQRIHRHDSTQLQELLQPKRGSAVRVRLPSISWHFRSNIGVSCASVRVSPPWLAHGRSILGETRTIRMEVTGCLKAYSCAQITTRDKA